MSSTLCLCLTDLLPPGCLFPAALLRVMSLPPPTSQQVLSVPFPSSASSKSRQPLFSYSLALIMSWAVSRAGDILLAPQQVDLARGEGLEELCSSKQWEHLCGTAKPASRFLFLKHVTKPQIPRQERSLAGSKHTGWRLHFPAGHSLGRRGEAVRTLASPRALNALPKGTLHHGMVWATGLWRVCCQSLE